jgi:hypothetical protein
MTIQEQLAGRWSLMSFEAIDAEGNSSNPFGTSPKGWLRYEADGFMCVQIMGSDRAAFASEDWTGSTAEEAQNAFDTYIAYFGTYEVDETEGSVTHLPESHLWPNGVGGRQKRFFTLDGDRLTLAITTPSQSGLIWKRVSQ